jgi:Leucine-rich repeat (LRR) protein
MVQMRPIRALSLLILLLASTSVLSISQVEQNVLNDMIDNLRGLTSLNKPWVKDTDPCNVSISSFAGLECRSNSIVKISLIRVGLVGAFPVSIGVLTGLEALQIAANNITGQLPASLVNLANLTSLTIWGNGMSGPIPPGITTLPKLEQFQIQDNHFSGPFPTTWTNSLSLVDMSGNDFTGPLPAQLFSLPRLATLRMDRLNLSSVNFTATIESSNLTQLTVFSMTNSKLQGPIPSFCSKMNRLKTLALDSNRLEGAVGPGLGCLPSLEVLSLENQPGLTSLTDDIAAPSNMTSIALNGCRISAIPVVLGTMPRLQVVRLFGNFMNGTIPSILFQSQSITFLALGGNRLNGSTF